MPDYSKHSGVPELPRVLEDRGFYTPPAGGTVMATQPPKRLPAPLEDAGGSANCSVRPLTITAHDVTEAYRNG